MSKQLIIPTPLPPSKEKAFVIVKSEIANSIKKKLLSVGTPPPANETKNIVITPDPSDLEIGKSLLGTPVYTRVVLRRSADTVTANDISGDGYIKLDNAIVVARQTKNIVTTSVHGKSGTIKELISDGDYMIDITARIISQYGNVSPVDQVNNLSKLLKEENELVIDSDFLQLLGVTYVVVSSYDFSQVEGSRGIIDFKMSLLSDEPVELELGITDNA